MKTRNAFVLFLSACGPSGSIDVGRSDADLGPVSDLRATDGSQLDTDLAAATKGTLVHAGGYEITDLTNDDHVLAGGGAPYRIAGVSIRDRSIKTVATQPMGTKVDGNAAFLGSLRRGGQMFWAPEEMLAWSSRFGAKILAHRSLAVLGRSSEDGEYLFYTDRATVDATRADLLVSRPDGTQSLLIAAQSVVNRDCVPNGRFFGHELVVNHCLPGMTGQPEKHEIVFVEPTIGRMRSIRQGVKSRPYWLDGASAQVFAADVNGDGQVIPVRGGPAVYVDRDVEDGLILPGGVAVVYRTSNGALRRRSIAPLEAPVTLVPDSVRELFLPQDQAGYAGWLPGVGQEYPAVSAGGHWIMYASQRDPNTGYHDLRLASTQKPGAPVVLRAEPDAIPALDPFTSDGRFALFLHGCELSQEFTSLFKGVFSSYDTMTGKFGVHSREAWVVRAGRQSQVIFGDRFQAEPSTVRGRVDLFWKDLAARGGPAVQVAPSVQSYFTVNRTRDKLVFSVMHDAPGVYVYDLP